MKNTFDKVPRGRPVKKIKIRVNGKLDLSFRKQIQFLFCNCELLHQVPQGSTDFAVYINDLDKNVGSITKVLM